MGLDEIRFTINTAGWKEDIKAKLEEQQKATLNQLAVFPGARPKPESWTEAPNDDFLRGYFNGVSFALNHWQALLDESESLRARWEQTRLADEAPPAGGPHSTEPLVVDTPEAKA